MSAPVPDWAPSGPLTPPQPNYEVTMTAPPGAADEHTAAVAQAIAVTVRDGNGRRVTSKALSLAVARQQAQTLLTSADPAVHNAMLVALTRAGALPDDATKAIERAHDLVEVWETVEPQTLMSRRRAAAILAEVIRP